MTLPSTPLDSVYPHIDVEVTYAEPRRVIERTYRVAAPATIEDVLRLVIADPAFAGIDVANFAVGVFGNVAAAARLLKDRDRVELYRPLCADPKIARRSRVRQSRKNS